MRHPVGSSGKANPDPRLGHDFNAGRVGFECDQFVVLTWPRQVMGDASQMATASVKVGVSSQGPERLANDSIFVGANLDRWPASLVGVCRRRRRGERALALPVPRRKSQAPGESTPPLHPRAWRHARRRAPPRRRPRLSGHPRRATLGRAGARRRSESALDSWSTRSGPLGFSARSRSARPTAA